MNMIRNEVWPIVCPPKSNFGDTPADAEDRQCERCGCVVLIRKGTEKGLRREARRHGVHSVLLCNRCGAPYLRQAASGECDFTSDDRDLASALALLAEVRQQITRDN